MSITYGDRLIDAGYFDITPEQWLFRDAHEYGEWFRETDDLAAFIQKHVRRDGERVDERVTNGNAVTV